jgi:hypothetical protein
MGQLGTAAGTHLMCVLGCWSLSGLWIAVTTPALHNHAFICKLWHDEHFPPVGCVQGFLQTARAFTMPPADEVLLGMFMAANSTAAPWICCIISSCPTGAWVAPCFLLLGTCLHLLHCIITQSGRNAKGDGDDVPVWYMLTALEQGAAQVLYRYVHT